MNAAVSTELGVFLVDLDDESVIGPTEGPFEPEPQPEVGLPLVVAAASSGSTIVAVVDRRPPLVVSGDVGRTWRETGGGLPAGRGVAIDPENPDVMLYAARSRLYVSHDGGRFWHALAVELPEIYGVSL